MTGRKGEPRLQRGRTDQQVQVTCYCGATTYTITWDRLHSGWVPPACQRAECRTGTTRTDTDDWDRP